MFTYTDTLAADRDKIRFSIADTEYEAGPKPNGANFTDAELDGLLAIEGTWQKAVADAFEALASAWSTHTTFTADGVSVSQSHIAERYAKEAEKWRKLYGYGGAASSGVVAITRLDGYSDDVSNEETL